MNARQQKWGNSSGVRIPSSIIKSLGLKNNDILDMNSYDNKIILEKKENKKISLADRFAKYNGENQAKDFVWDEPRGKEIW